MDPTTHADYHSKMSLGRTLYWSGVGAMGAGLLLGGWAFWESRQVSPASPDQASSWHLLPAVGGGLAGLQLTGGF